MAFKLTEFAHGSGCGCKLAPGILSEILKEYFAYADDGKCNGRLMRNDAMDDAAIFFLNDNQALVATTDFFMPIVDDAHDFGKIAAANALSDVYAMGAKPLFALNIVGFPVDKIPREIITRILMGGAEICRSAGITIAGGHSINASEPIYGLAVVGIIAQSHIKRNATAEVGDALILGKPLGVGILSSAFRRGQLKEDEYCELIRWTTKLNRIGEQFGALPTVHAMTDVTGFGLLGHLSEICKASQVSVTIDFNSVPILAPARNFAEQGLTTGAAKRNYAAYREHLCFSETVASWQKNLLLDPQTNGGLLVSCAAHSAQAVVEMFHRKGFNMAQKIGKVQTEWQHGMIQIQC